MREDEFLGKDDAELIKKIKEADLAMKLLRDPSWEIFREVLDKCGKKAVLKFMSLEADDVAKIAKLQGKIEAFRDLELDLNLLVRDGQHAIEELNEQKDAEL